MKAWPVKKLTVTALKPSWVLRVKRERGVADQHVDLAGLQHREADLGGGADVFDLLGIAEHGRGDRPAIGDVEPLPFAGGVLERKARNAGIDAADQLAAFLHGLQRRALRLALRRRRARRSHDAGHDGAGGQQSSNQTMHQIPPLGCVLLAVTIMHRSRSASRANRRRAWPRTSRAGAPTPARAGHCRECVRRGAKPAY